MTTIGQYSHPKNHRGSDGSPALGKDDGCLRHPSATVRKAPSFCHSTREAFTLIEMMVSIAVLAIMMVILAQATTSTSKLWQSTSNKISAFQNARAAFETMTATLAQATLNTYYEYLDAGGGKYTGQSAFVPAVYDRCSELHFVSGPAATLLAGVNRSDSTGSRAYPSVTSGHAVFFQAPLGYTRDSDAKILDNTLNALGYFVEFGTDRDFMPPLVAGKIAPRYRYRLIQFIQPAEDLSVYTENWNSHDKGQPASWFKNPLQLTVAAANNPRPARILADNIIALVIRPKYSDFEYKANTLPSLAPDYLYDSRPGAIIPPSQFSSYPSRSQLPPLIGVTLVTIDEASAIRLQARFGDKPPLEELGASKLFQNTADTNVPADYEADLEELKEILANEHINYRVFETELIIRASKWSQDS